MYYYKLAQSKPRELDQDEQADKEEAIPEAKEHVDLTKKIKTEDFQCYNIIWWVGVVLNVFVPLFELTVYIWLYY